MQSNANCTYWGTHRVLTISLSLATGALLGYFFLSHSINSSQKIHCPKIHHLVNPSLNCFDANEESLKTEVVLQNTQKVIYKYLAENKISNASVFYRNMRTNKFFGVNEFDSYTPGSLLKLPLAIAYYKLSELDPTILNTKRTYNKGDWSFNQNETFSPKVNLVDGNTYTTRELISKMIIDSDNDATLLLTAGVDEKFYKKVYADLVLASPADEAATNSITVKSYAAILRALYNSSYLHTDKSEEILLLMASSSFTNGITQGLNSGDIVAHKFGERTILNSAKQIIDRELHDCGIIYPAHDNDPYTLCIMTRGNDFTHLESLIKEITMIVSYSNNQDGSSE